MRVGNKVFPYPLLNHIQKLSNYINCNFDILYTFEETDKEVVFKDIKFETDSDLLNELYDAKKIDVVCIVECSDTVYRQKYRIGKNGFNLVLYKADLSEKTAITFFAYAIQNFIMESNEFEEDYRGVKFEIDKYDILAANDDQYITVKHQEQENNLAQSIFSVVNDHSKNDGKYAVDCLSKKITIYLSDEDYSNYKIIAGINEYKEIFFNMLLIPSLIEAIIECKNEAINGSSIEDIGDSHQWFRSIVKAYKKLYNEDLTVDVFKNIKPIEMSQELLGKPLNISFKKMIEENSVPEGDE